MRGQDLHLKTLSLDGGQVAVDGTVTALIYEEPRRKADFFPPLRLMAPAVAEQGPLVSLGHGTGGRLAFGLRLLAGAAAAASQATIPADLAFLALAVFALAYLGLALCHGRLQLFQLLGLAAGAGAYGAALSAWFRRVFRCFWQTVGRIFRLCMASPNSVEKNQKFLKISLFNWAQMGYNIR